MPICFRRGSKNVIAIENGIFKEFPQRYNLIALDDDVWNYYHWRQSSLDSDDGAFAALWWQNQNGVFQSKLSTFHSIES